MSDILLETKELKKYIMKEPTVWKKSKSGRRRRMLALQKWNWYPSSDATDQTDIWHGWIIRWKFEILLILIWQTSIMTSEYSIHL